MFFHVLCFFLTLSLARVIIVRKSTGHAFLAVSIVTRLVRDTLTVKVIMDFGALYIHSVYVEYA